MIKLSTLSKFVLPVLILSVITFFSQRSIAQCSAILAPAYSGNCANQYFSSISATGAGIGSTLTVSGVSSCSGTYINDFTTQGITAPLGGTLNLNLTRGGTLHGGYVTVYVDWNNDLTYSATELAGPVAVWSASSAAMTYPINIPMSGVYTGAAPNMHMRLMLSELPTGAPCTADTGQTYDFYFKVNTCANPVVTIAHTRDTFCNGGTAVTLTATGAGTGGTYVWMPSTGLSATTGATVFATPTVATTYTVTGYNSTGCPDTAVNAINSFNPPPAMAGAPSVCAGSAVLFTDSLAGGTWTSNNTSLATVSAISGVVFGVAAGVDLITYTMPTSCYTVGSILINPITIPAVNFTATPGFSVCDGTTVTYNATEVGGGTSPQYQWFINGVLMDTGITYTYIPLNGDIVSCHLTSNAICPTPATVVHNVTMVVNPILTPHVSIGSSLGDTTCNGVSVRLTALTINGGSGPLYQWWINALPVGTTAGTYSYVPANGDVIRVKLTSDEACQSVDTAVGYLQLTVLPYLLPSVHITATPVDTVCQGDHVIYSVTGTNGGLAPHYWWTVNGAFAATGASYNYVPFAGDQVKNYMISSYHCLSVDTARDSISVLVHPAEEPVVTIHVTPGTIIPAGMNATFNAVVTNIPASSTVTYQWYRDGFLQPSSVLSYYISHTFHSGDSIQVQVVDHGVCQDYSVFGYIIVYVGANVGVGNVNAEIDGVNLYPNPNSGNFTLEYTAGEAEELSVSVCDVTGRQITAQAWKVDEGMNSKAVELTGISQGIYFVKVSSPSGSKVMRITVE